MRQAITALALVAAFVARCGALRHLLRYPPARGPGSRPRARGQSAPKRHRRRPGRTVAPVAAGAHRAAGARARARHRRPARQVVDAATLPRRIGREPGERPSTVTGRAAMSAAAAHERRLLMVLLAVGLLFAGLSRTARLAGDQRPGRNALVDQRADRAIVRAPRHRRSQRPAARDRHRDAVALCRSGTGHRRRRSRRKACRCLPGHRSGAAALDRLPIAAAASSGCGAGCRRVPRQQVHDLGLPGLAFRRELKRAYPPRQPRRTRTRRGQRRQPRRRRHREAHRRDDRRRSGARRAQPSAATGAPVARHRRATCPRRRTRRRRDATMPPRVPPALVIDAATGEILAAASLPAIDPALPQQTADPSRLDRRLSAAPTNSARSSRR